MRHLRSIVVLCRSHVVPMVVSFAGDHDALRPRQTSLSMPPLWSKGQATPRRDAGDPNHSEAASNVYDFLFGGVSQKFLCEQALMGRKQIKKLSESISERVCDHFCKLYSNSFQE